MRLAMIAVAALGLSIASSLPDTGTPSVWADTQWCGLYHYGKTYRNNWGYYQVGAISWAWGWGGVWGGTYNNQYATYKHAALWTDAWDTDSWGFWGWHFKGWTADTESSIAPAETNQYNGHISRGATNHSADNPTCYWTTSDGF